MSKLSKADSDPRVKGWQENDIRKRLDDFLARGLPVLFEGLTLGEKVLVHADFCENAIWLDVLS